MSDSGCGVPPAGEPFAAVLESHLSVVVLLGGLAFKVKKPLQLPFIDLSTVAAREAVCRAELTLNRRLAPDVYLGLAGLDAPELPGLTGEPVLVMRRMPRDRRLTTLLAAGQPILEEAVDDVARQIARLHAAEPPVRGFDLAGSTERLWAAGDQQLRPYAGGVLPADQLAELSGLWREYLSGRAGLLREREARGLVRDGHGDLLADDIFCLDDGPRVLDCLEFDRALRVNDVLADVAFLAMDLDRLGAPELAARFVDRYREYSDEHHPVSLEHHYVAYRAYVRAKVECLRAGQGDAGAAARARVLLALAVTRLRAGRVHLVLVGGLPGSGKSTIAEGLAADPADRRREWVVLSSDVVRRDLCGGVRSAGAAEFGQGHYDPGHTEATYAELLRRTGLALRAGRDVVLDASFTDPARRREAADLAQACSAALVEVHCTAPVEVCERRLATRTDAHASDADVGVLHSLAARAPAWPQAHRVDTAEPLDRSLAAVRALLEGDQVCST